MKKISIILVAVLLMMCVTPVLADAPVDISISAGCSTLDAQLPVLGSVQLVSNTAAAILYETNTDTLMYAYNADSQVQPASLLKIMTALIAIEKGSMDDAVTVRKESLDTLPIDAAVVGLEIDEVLTVNDLLYSMMVSSGNDAAVVLAEHIMGSQEAFVAEMNRYAKELGCSGTNFTNVTGLHDKNQYTTARDVARILSKAIKNEGFSQVFGAKTYDVPKSNKSEVRNLATQNYLINNDRVEIYFDERVTGGRTAVNNDRSRSIASTAQVDGMNLICVVIGSRSQFEKDGYTEKVFGGYDETKQLLDMAFNGYKTAQILFADQVLQQRTVVNGNCDVSVGVKNPVYSVIPKNMDLNTLDYRYADDSGLTAPVEKGQELSALQIWNGPICIAETQTFAMNSVAVTGGDLNNTQMNGQFSVLMIILCVLGGLFAVILIVFLILFGLRRYRIFKVNLQARRHSKNRRRSR